MANEFWAGLFKGLGEGVGGIPDILQQRAEIENRNKMMAFELALGERGSKRKTKAARRAFLREESLQTQADRAAMERTIAGTTSREGIAKKQTALRPISPAEQKAADAELIMKGRKQFYDEAMKLYGKEYEIAIDTQDETAIRRVIGKIQNHVKMGLANVYGIDMGALGAEADSLKGVNYGTDNPYIPSPIDSSFTFDPQPADALRY